MKVIVSNCERQTHKGCIGMIGEITREHDFKGITFYEVTASNDGPYINGEHGKKIMSWRIGNKADFLKEELRKV